jgi:V/A-type H+-transporting ATPase subunit A
MTRDESVDDRDTGVVQRVAGPVVVATGLDRVRLYNVVRVGRRRLIGEVIRLSGDTAVIQVYESTGGLQVGSTVIDTGAPLVVELGPGLVGQVFDGVQRPLRRLAADDDSEYGRPFLRRGTDMPALEDVEWDVEITVSVGDRVAAGDVIATVQETPAIEHRVLLPKGRDGTVTDIADGPVKTSGTVIWVDDEPVGLTTVWPVRLRRDVAKRLDPDTPLVTGQRVVDVLYPVARGGSAAIPGGFGTGKTVHEQTLAKWSDADVIVYVGCGERGNEMAEVLEEFPTLVDPRTGASLMDRTILIANTSNMPVAAREASIYTAITIAEYYRDQGYDVAVMADSTSRWGEALREVSSRLEEMPGEEGYPAYLPSRLAEFYERSGAAEALGAPTRQGSVTVIGAVSPPGGDFSEPVTQYSLRLAGTFWALDPDLARRRHYPAIHWSRSYSLYDLDDWYDEQVDRDWSRNRAWALELLGREDELQSIVRLLGADSLAPVERVTFHTGRILREDFLQQSAFDEVDAYCPLPKQFWMLAVIRHAHERLTEMAAAEDADPERLIASPALGELGRMKYWAPESVEQRAKDLIERLTKEVGAK